MLLVGLLLVQAAFHFGQSNQSGVTPLIRPWGRPVSSQNRKSLASSD